MATTPTLLHSNLAPLARASSTDGARYAMQGILIEHLDDLGPDLPAGYRAVATDGRILVLVEGRTEPYERSEFPSIPALETAPNGSSKAIIPARVFTQAMKDAPSGRLVANKPILGRVACVMGEQVSTLATTDLETNLVRQPRNVEGRFPDYASVFPETEPAVTISFNAHLLVELLKIAATFTPDDADGVVKIEVRTKNTPLVVRCQTAGGEQKFTGLCMPLS